MPLGSGEIFSPEKLGCFEGTRTDFVYSKRHKIKSCFSDVGPSKEEKMDQSCLCLCSKTVKKKKPCSHGCKMDGCSHSAQKPAWSALTAVLSFYSPAVNHIIYIHVHI